MSFFNFLFKLSVIAFLVAILWEVNYLEYTLHVVHFNYPGSFTDFFIDSFKELFLIKF